MAGQARDLQMTAGCETSAIITARACPAPPRLLAQALSVVSSPELWDWRGRTKALADMRGASSEASAETRRASSQSRPIGWKAWVEGEAERLRLELARIPAEGVHPDGWESARDIAYEVTRALN